MSVNLKHEVEWYSWIIIELLNTIGIFFLFKIIIFISWVAITKWTDGYE